MSDSWTLEHHDGRSVYIYGERHIQTEAEYTRSHALYARGTLRLVENAPMDYMTRTISDIYVFVLSPSCGVI